MDIKQEFREEKNMDVYATNVNDGSFSNVYVKWLESKLTLTDVSQQRELSSCDCPKCGKEMISEWVKHHHCNKCKEHYTST
jgi:tRNA(Ile2) C34 agmatinyltransferase TiaS